MSDVEPMGLDKQSDGTWVATGLSAREVSLVNLTSALTCAQVENALTGILSGIYARAVEAATEVAAAAVSNATRSADTPAINLNGLVEAMRTQAREGAAEALAEVNLSRRKIVQRNSYGDIVSVLDEPVR